MRSLLATLVRCVATQSFDVRSVVNFHHSVWTARVAAEIMTVKTRTHIMDQKHGEFGGILKFTGPQGSSYLFCLSRTVGATDRWRDG